MKEPSLGGGIGKETEVCDDDGLASTKAARSCGFNKVNLDLKESDGVRFEMGIEPRVNEEKGC